MKDKEAYDKGELYPHKENQVKIKQDLTKKIQENLKDQGFEYMGEVEQEDTYYVGEGDQLEDKNLRVRRSGGEIMITVKHTEQKSPVRVRDKVSYGPIESEGEVEEMKNKHDTHQEVAVVRKKRKIFKLFGGKNQPKVQVNVDDVKGLGQFIEVKADRDLSSPKETLHSVVDNLGLNLENEEKKTYAQLSLYVPNPPAHALAENLMSLFDELGVRMKNISSGMTEITVLTLAFVIGMGSSLRSREIVLASILIISISNAIAATAGLYTRKKLDYFSKESEVRRLSLLNFLVMGGTPLLYIPAFIFLSLSGAILVSMIISFVLLFFMSILVAAVERKSYVKSIALHIALFIGVSFLAYGISELIELFLVPVAGL